MSSTPFRRPRAVLVAVGTLALAVGSGVGVAAAAPSTDVTHSVAHAVPRGGLARAPMPGSKPVTPTPTPSTPAPTPTIPVPATKIPGEASPVEIQLFTALNQQRASNGLGPVTWSNQLNLSSLAHNQTMAAANTMSHQLPGEAAFGDRITAAGYRWRAAAENIGWNSRANDDGAVALQWMFYNETPPNDGHRRNILSTATSQVGISVFYDGKGKVWVTEDFGQPR